MISPAETGTTVQIAAAMVPQLDIEISTTSSSASTKHSDDMTNSEMELSTSNNGDCLLLEEQHLIHMDQSNVVFGSMLIDQNSATPYSDATKVRVKPINSR